jgi:hypothetical protein
MKFNNKIRACRHDGETPFRILTKPQKVYKADKDCIFYNKGLCKLDSNKCVIVTYIKEKV